MMTIPSLTRPRSGGDEALGDRQRQQGAFRAASSTVRHLTLVSVLVVAVLAGRTLRTPLQALVFSALLGAVAMAARRAGFGTGAALALGTGGLGALGLASHLALPPVDPTAPFLFAAEGLILSLWYSADIRETRRAASDKTAYVRSARVSVLDQTAAPAAAQAMPEDVTGRFRAFMENSPCGASIKNNIGIYRFVNHSFEVLFQTASSRVLGKTDADLFTGPEALRRHEADGLVLETGEPVQIAESVVCPDGLVREFLTLKFLFVDSLGQKMIGGITLNVPPRKAAKRALAQKLSQAQRLIDELAGKTQRLEQANALLRHQANTDPLTGLRNRRAFFGALKAALSERNRHPRPLSVLMLDVDSFKAYNDDFGHAAGDEVLGVVASLLTVHARAHDLPARYGGEEFVVLLPGASEPEALTAASRLREAIATYPWPLRSVTASFGVASLAPHERLDAHSLMECADRALYHSKCTGRNRSSHASDLRPPKTASLRPNRTEP